MAKPKLVELAGGLTDTPRTSVAERFDAPKPDDAAYERLVDGPAGGRAPRRPARGSKRKSAELGEPLLVRLPPDLLDGLRHMAVDERASLTHVVTDLVRAAVIKWRKNQRP
jgi:hypothetical protein